MKQAIIIDDDPNIRCLVNAILSAEGYTVNEAENGRLGVELVERTKKVDLIVLDVMMPEMNGLDVLARLRIHPETAKLPVLMLTGEDRPEDMMAGYEYGADYYLTKPFNREQLIFGIRQVLAGL